MGRVCLVVGGGVHVCRGERVKLWNNRVWAQMSTTTVMSTTIAFLRGWDVCMGGVEQEMGSVWVCVANDSIP